MPDASFHHAVGEFRCFFQCEHCGFGQGALVRSAGLGHRTFLRGHAHADAMASADAKNKAEETLHFVPCPECGKTSSEGARIFRRAVHQTVGASVAVMALGIVVAFATDVGKSIFGVAVAISIGMGVFAGLMTWFTTPAPWRHVAERVDFDS